MQMIWGQFWLFFSSNWLLSFFWLCEKAKRFCLYPDFYFSSNNFLSQKLIPLLTSCSVMALIAFMLSWLPHLFFHSKPFHQSRCTPTCQCDISMWMPSVPKPTILPLEPALPWSSPFPWQQLHPDKVFRPQLCGLLWLLPISKTSISSFWICPHLTPCLPPLTLCTQSCHHHCGFS